MNILLQSFLKALLFASILYLTANFYVISKTPMPYIPKQPTEQERIEHRRLMKFYGLEQTEFVDIEADGTLWFYRKSDGKKVRFK